MNPQMYSGINAGINPERTQAFVGELWDRSIIGELIEYIRIPCKSPHFDSAWAANGYIDQAVDMMTKWCKANAVPGMKMEVVRFPERTPVIFIEIDGDGADGNILLYGHLDKQPEMSGWRDDLGPWKPVLEDGKLYGRGGADDGYAIYGSLAAVLALKDQDIPHANLKILIEASEESGSPDLPAYMEVLAVRIGQPDLLICLDSGCGDYGHLWCTTSLRGLVSGVLRVDVLQEGVHSGDAGGVVPSSFRIARQLLNRIENPESGEILPAAFHCEIPSDRRQQAQLAADVLGDAVFNKFLFAGETRPVIHDHVALVLNRTWRSALEIVGMEGVPTIANGGNVLRPSTSLKLSLRIPPTLDAADVTIKLKELLEADPPSNAKVLFTPEQSSDGWNAPPVQPWLKTSIDNASKHYFNQTGVLMGEGGTIPFIAMLGERFPEAQFLITGVLGPHSNAHGPNEFLHIETGKRVTACVAEILAHHYREKNP